MGARPMARLIQDTIRSALADELLFGNIWLTAAQSPWSRRPRSTNSASGTQFGAERDRRPKHRQRQLCRPGVVVTGNRNSAAELHVQAKMSPAMETPPPAPSRGEMSSETAILPVGLRPDEASLAISIPPAAPVQAWPSPETTIPPAAPPPASMFKATTTRPVAHLQGDRWSAMTMLRAVPTQGKTSRATATARAERRQAKTS